MKFRSRTAEERQDRSEKRRRIDRENQQSHSQRNSAQNHSQLSAGGGKTHRNGTEYVEVNANGTTATTSSTGLPSKPTWSAGEADKEAEKAAPVAVTGAMVNSNASIVANRKALRMANLSAADMIKAELAAAAGGEGELSTPAEKEAVEDAEMVDSKALEEEQKAEEAGQVDAEKNAKAAAKLKAELLGGGGGEEDTSPRGTKRPAPPEAPSAEGAEAVEEEATDADEDAEVNAFLTDSLLPPKPAELIAGLDVAQPPPLKLMGNNVVEQDDTVKCVPLPLPPPFDRAY